jgi:hypothetical protein
MLQQIGWPSYRPLLPPPARSVKKIFCSALEPLAAAGALADKGLQRALSEDPHLRDGLNLHAGRITYRAVADALKLPYTDADHVLRI